MSDYIPDGSFVPGAMLDDYSAIRTALEGIADGPVDSGMGMGSADFWAIINGTEYYIQARVKQR